MCSPLLPSNSDGTFSMKHQSDTPLDRWRRAFSQWSEEYLGRLPKLPTTFGILALTSLVITLILLPTNPSTQKKFASGEIAEEDIRSDRKFLVLDKEASESKRQKALAKLKDVYTLHQKQREQLVDNIHIYFERGREWLRSHKRHAGPQQPDDIIEERLFADILPLGSEIFGQLKAENFARAIEQKLVQLLKKNQQALTIQGKDHLASSLEKGIVLIDDQSGKRETITDAETRIGDFDAHKKDLEEEFFDALQSWPKERQELTIAIALALLSPTVSLNEELTKKLHGAVLRKVEDIFIPIEKNEIIIRKGDKISPHHQLVLEQLFDGGRSAYVPGAVGLFLLFTLLFFVICAFSSKFLSFFDPSTKDLLFLAVLLIVTTATSQVYLFVTHSLSYNFSSIPLDVYQYGIPVFASCMLVRLFLNAETSFVFVLLNCTLAAGMQNFSFKYFAFCLVGSLACISALKHCSQRITLFKVGVFAGLINVATFVIFSLLIKRSFSFASAGEFISSVFIVMTSGILSSVLVLALGPLFELFDYTSDVKLLELANSDHPLLGKLAIQAPATHHHSFIVGLLAEHAAEAIGGNPLLARVASLYHDIGKIGKPHYFAENQGNLENKHDSLTPRMSTLIVISHVKDGIELAIRHKLPKVIRDVIPQHHGTNVISYFYKKAKELEDPDVDSVNENDFRYPGPKPQFKEAAIIMMADTIEATARSLSDPTPSKLEHVVRSAINRFATDGQFDECGITFRDLNTIAKSFLKTLTTSIYHHRIDYQQKVISKNMQVIAMNPKPAPASAAEG